MSPLEIIGLDPIATAPPNTDYATASGPRCAVTRDGQIVCTYMAQSKLGINDFKMMQTRSRDGGTTWSDPTPLWPHLHDRWSIFASVSGAPNGDLMIFGTRYPIDTPGETFWSQDNFGLKQNELIWARSRDGGQSWTDPMPFAMPAPGSAEAPGPMCVTRAGRWLCCYAPYNTFDPKLKVDRAQLATLASDDQGQTWRYTPAMRFAVQTQGSAEAWIVQLADGRLLAACWHFDYADMTDQPNPYALSEDDGRTWLPHRSTGIRGQSVGLCALPDGRAIMVYNQRKHGEPGVYLAIANPDADGFNLQTSQIAWRAAAPTQSGTSTAHANWTDFSFGEPSATLLPDGTLLIALWRAGPDFAGIWGVRVRM